MIKALFFDVFMNNSMQLNRLYYYNVTHSVEHNKIVPHVECACAVT